VFVKPKKDEQVYKGEWRWGAKTGPMRIREERMPRKGEEKVVTHESRENPGDPKITSLDRQLIPIKLTKKV